MKTISELRLLPVWVSPDHLVATARILLSGHRLKALGVVDERRLVGIVTPEELASAPPESQVRTVMLPPQNAVESDASVRGVADQMVREDLDFVPVVSRGAFVGILSSTMLLREMGRTWDPLTGLSWSDRLREWGVEHLKEGREVTIVFLDLDDFGTYNKRFGHIVGDRVLQKVAAMLKECTDESRDALVRFGGDEFAIGTLRTPPETERLIDLMNQRMSGMFVGEGEHPVTFSSGSFGGRRSKERENVHYAATLDSLINLASKDCMKRKASNKLAQQALETATIEVGGRAGVRNGAHGHSLSVLEVNADDRSPGALITVSLSKGESLVMGFQARGDSPIIEQVAAAAAKAVERAMPGSQVRIEEIRLGEQQPGIRTVSVNGRFRADGRDVPFGNIRTVEGDMYRAAAEAVVEGVQSIIAG